MTFTFLFVLAFVAVALAFAANHSIQNRPSPSTQPRARYGRSSAAVLGALAIFSPFIALDKIYG